MMDLPAAKEGKEEMIVMIVVMTEEAVAAETEEAAVVAVVEKEEANEFTSLKFTSSIISSRGKLVNHWN